MKFGSISVTRRNETIRLDDLDTNNYTTVTESEFESLLETLFFNNVVYRTAHWRCSKCNQSVADEEVSFNETHIGCGGKCN